jgi:chromosome segregation ATPase
MFKNWFLLASVSCGIGFGTTFLISRNLQQSTLAGLGTVPAVAATMTILSRQRREEIERQVAKSRLGLDDVREQVSIAISEKQANLDKIAIDLVQAEVRKQSAIDSAQKSKLTLANIKEQIYQNSAIKEKLRVEITDLQNKEASLKTILANHKVDLSKIESKISQREEQRNKVSIEIANLDISLKQKQSLFQNIDRQQQLLHQEISDLLLKNQDQKVLFDNLVLNISTKKNELFKLDTEISRTQAALAKIAIDLVQAEARKQSAIDSAQRSQLALTNIQEKIRQDSAIKEELKLKITDLQNQAESLQAEISTQNVYRTAVQQQISVLKEQQDQISTSVNDLNRSVEEKTSSLDDLNLEIWNKQQYKANIYSEITELENSISLFSVHTTGDLLNTGIADLYKRWLEVSQQISRLEDKENEASIIAPDLVIEAEPSIIAEEWESHLVNNRYLPVFQHIDKWGSITEGEVNDILGNARTGRQFNREFREYYQYLPFSIRVETSNNSSRYVKEIITISESQNLLYIPQQKIVDLHTEPEDDVIQYSNTNNESQSDDYLAERMIHTYPVCLFCERPPMPGQDRCNNCN